MPIRRLGPCLARYRIMEVKRVFSFPVTFLFSSSHITWSTYSECRTLLWTARKKTLGGEIILHIENVPWIETNDFLPRISISNDNSALLFCEWKFRICPGMNLMMGFLPYSGCWYCSAVLWSERNLWDPQLEIQL